MRNVFLALLHEWAENSLKEVTVIFIERKYFNKMSCPWTGVIPCVPGHLIPRAKPKPVGLGNKQTNTRRLPAACQLRTGAAEMDFLLVKHNVNLCSWNSSLKTGHSCPCLQSSAARQAGWEQGASPLRTRAASFRHTGHLMHLPTHLQGPSNAATAKHALSLENKNSPQDKLGAFPCQEHFLTRWPHQVKFCWSLGSLPPATIFWRVDGPIRGLIIPTGLSNMPVPPLAWRTGDGIFCYQAVTHPCLDDPGIIPSSLCFGHSFPCAVGTATSLATPHRDVYSPLGINSLNFHTQGQAGKKKKPHPVWVRCNSACKTYSGLVVTSSCDVISWADSSCFCVSRVYEYTKG